MDGNASVCPYASWVTEPPGSHRGRYDPAVAEGKALWWYQSCMSEGCAHTRPASGGCDPSKTCTKGTWPSYMIDAPATFNRAMSWMSYAYDMHGELYWGVNAADRQSNSSWQDQWLAGGNGDGSLTYPGRTDEIGGSTFVPVASQRLKHIRDGLEDLELMYLAEARAGRDAVLAQVRRVVRTAYDFEHAPQPMLAVRQALAQMATGAGAVEEAAAAESGLGPR